MALNQEQQFRDLIVNARHILIAFRKNYTGDGLASALSLARFLSLLNKKCTLVADDFKPTAELAFLSGVHLVNSELANLRHSLIEVDLGEKQMGEFSYEVVNNKLIIYLLPEKGEIVSQDVQVRNSNYRFDLIITLDAPDLESLGKIYQTNSDFFYQTTIVNIDHNLNNENYGQLNLVNPNCSSVAEIVFSLIKNYQADLIDGELATLMLAGIIHKTQSFRKSSISPETLRLTAELINLGADKEKIVTNFYRTKNLATLKLWGRVLARLQLDNDLKLAWASLPRVDFLKTGSSEMDLQGLAEEMVLNSPQAENFLLIYENNFGGIGGYFYTRKHDARWLLNTFEVGGTKEIVSFGLANKSLADVEGEMLKEIRIKLAEI